MKIWVIILRVTISIVGVVIIGFNVLLYTYCKQQRTEMNSLRDKLDVESKFNSNKFKSQQDQIDTVKNDLEDARQQIKEQKDAMANEKEALLQEIEKRQQVENDNKNIQTSLVDIKAEADAIKQDMKGWQKDYVSVLANIEKKMEDSQAETKIFEDNLAALKIPELKENINSLKVEIEKLTHPSGHDMPDTPAVADIKGDHSQIDSQ